MQRVMVFDSSQYVSKEVCIHISLYVITGTTWCMNREDNEETYSLLRPTAYNTR